jgi:hypothetical protein
VDLFRRKGVLLAGKENGCGKWGSMMFNKRAKSTVPRHKRLNRASRLQAAKHWLHKYQGKNLLHGYSKHFGVDLLCAIVELQMLNVSLDEKYVNKVKQSVEGLIKAREKRKEELRRKEGLSVDPYSDETFSFITGYTDGGAPYGITWEEQTEIGMEDEDGIDGIPF